MSKRPRGSQMPVSSPPPPVVGANKSDLREASVAPLLWHFVPRLNVTGFLDAHQKNLSKKESGNDI